MYIYIYICFQESLDIVDVCFTQKMREGKEKKGMESAAVCSAQFLNVFDRFLAMFFIGRAQKKGKGAGKNITKPRFDRVILAGCVWKWQGVLPLFTFDAISLVPFALPTLPSPQRHQTFSIALRPYYRRFPSFPILSFLLLTLHPCLFPGGIVSISLWRARIKYRQINDRLKYNSFTQREERDNSIVFERIASRKNLFTLVHFSWYFSKWGSVFEKTLYGPLLPQVRFSRTYFFWNLSVWRGRLYIVQKRDFQTRFNKANGDII